MLADLDGDGDTDAFVGYGLNTNTTSQPNEVWLNELMDGAFSFGTGASIAFDALVAGTHTIVATVTDAAGATVSDVVVVTVIPPNMPPVLVNNSLTVTEGETVVLSSAELSATDEETAAADLSFTMSSVLNGEFLLSGAPATTFIQADVTNNLVAFVHNGSDSAPSYYVSVSDGEDSTIPGLASIFFTGVNDAPSVSLTNEVGSLDESIGHERRHQDRRHRGVG